MIRPQSRPFFGVRDLLERFFLHRMIVFATLVLTLALGCAPEEASRSSDRLQVVATTGMIANLVSEVGGDRVDVVGLMGPGVDPHYYKATQGDLRHLTNADLIFYNGLFLEGKMEDIFKKMSRNKTVVAVAHTLSEGLHESVGRLRRPPEFKGHFDPHIWFDVGLWSLTIAVVDSTLSAAEPANADSFHARAARYAQQLDELDAWVQAQVNTIPVPRRVLITAHDAFGYFGKAYGLEVLGLQGISTVAEYGVNDVRRLVAMISERKIPAIFVESSVPERSINAVREGCLARGHEVVIGGTLYSDAMGAAGSGADTYVGMVRTNVATIAGALR
jgi:manganese/zinc/iron transport system substrate-binding protein